MLTRNLNLVEVVAELANVLSQTSETLPNLEGFLAELSLAVEQTTLSLEAMSSPIDPLENGFDLIAMEQLASWRDRPFHPTARAKVGWDEAAYRRYSPEFKRTLSLAWVAVRRDYLMCSQAAAEKPIAELILNHQERSELAASLQDAGITEADYVALPVHPWQQQHILPPEFSAEIQSGICVPLQLQTGAYFPTSSLRSLAPVRGTYKAASGYLLLGCAEIVANSLFN